MSSFIYFIRPVRMIGPVKIGCSRCPEWRLKELMRWSPLELEIAARTPGNFRLERNIHDCLARYHSHKEWFHPAPAILDLVSGVRAGGRVEDLLDLSARQGQIVSFPRRHWTPEMRLYMSLTGRLRAILRRHPDGEGRELRRRLREWSGHGCPPGGLADDIRRFIANPAPEQGVA